MESHDQVEYLGGKNILEKRIKVGRKWTWKFSTFYLKQLQLENLIANILILSEYDIFLGLFFFLKNWILKRVMDPEGFSYWYTQKMKYTFIYTGI